jgi:hypothetical protein
MAYFPDLSPYAFGHHAHPGVVHVGWVDNVHAFPRGIVEARFIERMKRLAAKPVELYRGKHICELCVEPLHLVKTNSPNRVVIDPKCSWAQWAGQRSSNGEIRVSRGGVTFAAPVLIVHYIEEHGYLPPSDFLKAVEEAVS